MRIIKIAQFDEDEDVVSRLKNEIDEETTRNTTDTNVRQRKQPDPNRTPNGKFYLLQDLLGNDDWEKFGSYPSAKKLCKVLYDHLSGLSESGEYTPIEHYLAISPDMTPIPLWIAVIPDNNLGRWMMPLDYPCVGTSENEVDGIMQSGYRTGKFPERMEYQTFSNEESIEEFRANPGKFGSVMQSRSIH